MKDRGSMMLHFKGSDYRISWGSTWYDRMDRLHSRTTYITIYVWETDELRHIAGASLVFNAFLFSVRNKSSTDNRRITDLPPSTLKQRLESALLSVNSRVISNLSIFSYHVEPYIFCSHSLLREASYSLYLLYSMYWNILYRSDK